MRHLLIAAVLLLPTAAHGQFPPPGNYAGEALVAGSADGPGAITLAVRAEGDSTALSIYAGDNPEQTVPITDQGVIDQGWTIVLGVIPGGLHCRFVTLSTKWEAYCEDEGGSPQFEIWFDRTPVPMKEETP